MNEVVSVAGDLANYQSARLMSRLMGVKFCLVVDDFICAPSLPTWKTGSDTVGGARQGWTETGMATVYLTGSTEA